VKSNPISDKLVPRRSKHELVLKMLTTNSSTGNAEEEYGKMGYMTMFIYAERNGKSTYSAWPKKAYTQANDRVSTSGIRSSGRPSKEWQDQAQGAATGLGS
jgi:hypothetical protein